MAQTQAVSHFSTSGDLSSPDRQARKWPVWLWVVLLAFALVYARSLTPVYAEGDDATSIAYHLFGRDREFQSPYSPYQGMMDVFLSIVPPQEAVLRTVSIAITSLATLGMIALMLVLVFQWLGPLTPVQKTLVTVTALLASPEFFYLGLVYSPTAVAMCLMLTAHLCLRATFRGENAPDFTSLKARVLAPLSLALFGIGAACRWSTVTYGAVIVADLLFAEPLHLQALRLHPRRTKLALGWGILALASSLVAVVASGLRQADLVGVFGTLEFVLEEARIGVSDPSNIARSTASLSPLVTPACAILAILGLATLLRRRDPRLIALLAGIGGVAPWITTGTPKFLLPAVPGMALCVAKGVLALWHGVSQPRWRLISRLAMGLLLVLPWIVGIRVAQADSAWGPGFELRPFTDTGEATPPTLVVGPGAALPTSEGPRPLFGHGFVLGGGEWRSLLLSFDAERQRLIEQALERGAPIVVTNWSPELIVNRLVGMGYTTADPEGHVLAGNEYFLERRFTDEQGQVRVVMLFHEVDGGGTLDDFRQLASLDERTVALSAYPSIVRHLWELAPDALESLGARSALVDTERLGEELDRLTEGGPETPP